LWKRKQTGGGHPGGCFLSNAFLENAGGAGVSTNTLRKIFPTNFGLCDLGGLKLNPEPAQSAEKSSFATSAWVYPKAEAVGNLLSYYRTLPEIKKIHGF
jgi:hypothetical protein